MKKLLLSCIIAIAYIGCGSSSSETETSTFKAWNGSYKSVNPALEDERMDETYSQIAKDKNKTQAEVKQAIINLLTTKGYENLVFEGNSITYTYENQEPFTYTYKTSGVSDDERFYLFTSTSDVLAHPELKYIYTTKPHQDTNESMIHFHFKFGANGFDELKTSNSYPTFAKSSTSLEKMIEDYQNAKDELANFIQ